MQSTSEKAPCCASRTCRVVVLWTVQLLAIPVCAFVPFGNEALTALIAVCIVVGRLLPLCVKRAIKPADVQKEAPRVANDTPTATESTKSTKPVKTRLLWLDILKLGLTVLVIVHHCTASFLGTGGFAYMLGDYLHPFQAFGVAFMALNASYFMSLFFFISAYFTPSSHQRKGEFAFMQDKFTRLGIPFVCYVLVIGPAINVLLALLRGQSPGYAPDPGPTWFLAWLCIFNAGYSFRMRAAEAASLTPSAPPSLAALCLLGACCGALNAAMMPFVSNLATLPFTFGTFPFYIIFFEGGIRARRNGWLDVHLPELSAAERTAARIVSAIVGAGGFAFTATLYISGGGLKFMPAVPGEDPAAGPLPKEDNFDGRDVDTISLGFVLCMLGVGTCVGVFCMAFTVALLDWCRLHANWQTASSRRLCEVAYSAYLVQGLVLPLIVYGYAEALAALGHPTYFRPGSWASATRLPEAALVLGWLATSTLSVIGCWALGALLRCIPGLSNVL